MLRKALFSLLAVLSLVVGLAVVVAVLLPPAAIPISASIPAAISRLTHDPANAVRPAWSPDNHLIAFESNRDGPSHIYVMNADGSQPRALTNGASDDRHPVWSADGRSILYDSSDGTRQGIWSVGVADGSRKQLTRVDGLADYGALSPDGQRLAFYVYKDMTLNLWSARADGSDARPLTTDLADARRHEPTMAWRQPGWSPDSQSLAYTGGDGRSIWTMRSDGSNARSVVADGETNHFPWFLPDGRLAYITEYVPPNYDGAWTNAWALDLQSGKRTLLQDHMSMQGPMDFSADGSRVLFHSPRAGSFDIYLVDLKTRGGLAALQGTPVPVETADY
jgi:Tol biopolymer transport system component